MSNDAINWAKSLKTGSASRKAVLLNLADRADERWSCFPSIDLIAKETELSKRTIMRALQQLDQDGFIAIEKRSGVRSRYTLLSDEAVTGDGASPVTQATGTGDTDDIPPTPPHKDNPKEPPERARAQSKPPPTYPLREDDPLPVDLLEIAVSEGVNHAEVHGLWEEFACYWQDRRQRRSERGWRQCWRNHARRAAERSARALPRPNRSEPESELEEICRDYGYHQATVA